MTLASPTLLAGLRLARPFAVNGGSEKMTPEGNLGLFAYSLTIILSLFAVYLDKKHILLLKPVRGICDVGTVSALVKSPRPLRRFRCPAPHHSNLCLP